MEQLPEVPFLDISGGMMSYPADALIPLNTAKLSLNFHYDETGRAVQRSGTTKLNDTVSSGTTCRGLGQYINSAGTKNRLVAVFNKDTYYNSGSGWSACTGGGLSTDTKVRFASFIDLMFRVGGGSATKSWDGDAGDSWGDTQLASAPDGKFILPFKSRLYIAGNDDYPDRLYRSTVVDVDGNITWDNSTQYVDVNPEDGDNITGLAKVGNMMLILKERAIYRWNGSATDPEIVIDVGTSSQESVAQAKGLVFYYNPEGIFVTDGGYPKEISKPLDDWFPLVSSSFYSDVAAFCDHDHYYCNLGSITKGGRTYNNVWYVFTISNQTQFLFSLADSFRFMTKYVKIDGSVTYVGGDTDGDVQTFFSGNTDNGTEIEYLYRTPDRYFDGRSHRKTIQEVVAYMENGAGAEFRVIGDDGKPETIGQIKGRETVMDGLNVSGRRIRFELSGTNKAEPVAFEGFEVLDMVTEGNPEKNG